MRWRAENSADQEKEKEENGSINSSKPASSSTTTTTTSATESSSRIDDDEQDYPAHNRYDEDEDDDDMNYHIESSGSVDAASTVRGVAPSHHHAVDEFEPIAGGEIARTTPDMAGFQLNHEVSSLPNSQISTSSLPLSANPDLSSSSTSTLPPSSSGSMSAGADPISGLRATNINIESNSIKAMIEQNHRQEEDDPGQDHAVPDEGFDSLNSSAVWSPQSQQSTCEFTHTITNYSSKRESGCKKAEYSSTTVDSFGNRWRLIVYVNGNGRASNHHLSLFLQVADADELPFGWKKGVSYVLTLEHPSGPSLGYAKRNPDKTFKLCPKAIDWGWSQFITSDRIQQEGYIANDSLIVRASVTVKSSSICIDPEDAELYLKCAVEEGNAEAVELCLQQGAGVNCQFKDDLYTPLHTACSSSTSSGSLKVLQLLLDQGADGNACNKWRETPLLIAANNGHLNAVEALLRKGADPSMCSEAGWSALTFAAHKGYDDIVTLLLAAGAPVNCRVIEDLSTPLHKACAGGKPGHLSAVKQLLKGKADVHALNKWRETPLLTAANHGQAEAVKALLDKGGDPCKCTDTGWSPLSIAAYKGHDDVVRLLLEQGAPTEEADPTLSALLQAATKGLPDTVELLLRHGADHTVTTKKGDTALSILVEQNLIDAAVEMVMEYKASVPRCSRDRKKVQRARLLINLRVKQQKEGILNDGIDSEDESDQDASDDGSNSALHDREISPKAAAPPVLQRKNKKNKNKNKRNDSKSRENAEAEARAAEEALLLELEQEDAKAQKDEAAANTKRNKKKKKKERERQQKLQEERVKRDKEEKEAAERQKLRLQEEEKERKIREEKAKELQAIEMREAAERAAREKTRRKEKEDREKKLREKQKEEREKSARAKKKATTTATTNQQRKPSIGNDTLKDKKQTKNNKMKKPEPSKKFSKTNEPSKGNSSTNKSGVPGAAATQKSVTKNRGWETKNTSQTRPTANSEKTIPSQPSDKPLPSHPTQMLKNVPQPQAPVHAVSGSPDNSVEDMLENMANGVVGFLGFDSAPDSIPGDIETNVSDCEIIGQEMSIENMVNGVNNPGNYPIVNPVENPAVSEFRQHQISEMFQTFSSARSSSVIDESMVKRVMYNWIVRASHASSEFLDPIIPSWSDLESLIEFTQRQLISENRRASTINGVATANIEVLKEAGSSMAETFYSSAKKVIAFRNECEQMTGTDVSDDRFNINLSQTLASDHSPMVVIEPSQCSKVYLTEKTFTNLRNRYRGAQKLFLTSIFSAVKRYDTLHMLTSGTEMDFKLPASTVETLVRELGVSMELNTDLQSVYGNNFLCGTFPDVEASFGALHPLGFSDDSGEASLKKQGGSIVVMPPLESTTASLYIEKILDLLETPTPLSFLIMLPMQCFRKLATVPVVEDLSLLDNRLTQHCRFIRHVESLPAGQHMFDCGDTDTTSSISQTGSLLLLLQNDAGQFKFPLLDTVIMKVKSSMGLHYVTSGEVSPPAAPSPIVFPNFIPETVSTSMPSSPHSANMGGSNIDYSNTATSTPILGNVFNNDFNNETAIGSRRSGRSGRLFDLVDDGEENVDVVTDMMNTLGMSVFQNNPSQDNVDIEAISLMGIGTPRTGDNPNSLPQKGRFG